jgi:hypothetical protein
MIPKLRKHDYLARVSIFLIAVALIVGTVSCDGGGGGGPYTLTMLVSPGGSGTATDLTNASPYTAGTVVNITAVANPCYQFVSWSAAPPGTFGNATAATTNFTMPAQNVIVTANFVRVCYNLTMAANPAGGGTATDLTGGSPYAAGTVVNITAVANPCYQFVNWTSSDGGTFGNATAATTNFTMPAQDVTVTANFVRVCYNLTMAANPVGGGTATDVTNASPYAAGTVVNITAVANQPYQFVNWTSSDGGTFGNATAATTNFTMPAQDVTVTANFVGPLDHFKWYFADGAEPISEVVYLEDQFGAFNATVGYAAGFGNPAEKQHGQNETPIYNPDHHLTAYYITCEEEPQTWFVEVENQFGLQNLTVYGPIALLLPTQKEGHQPPVNLDHYLLYEVTEGEPVDETVTLQDQFDDEPQESLVYEPVYFANPVQKTYKGEVTEILDPEAHLVIYTIDASFSGEVGVVNQFGEQTLDVYTYFGYGGLAVPSEKIECHQEPDHYLGYLAYNGTQYIGENVTLEDRFGAVNATVTYPLTFANPAEKWYDGVLSPIGYPDIHVLTYNITCESEPGAWLVVVENQFGIQELTVSGPTWLNAPAQKLEPYYHDPPVGAWHSLSYDVIAGEAVNQAVDLSDEFDDFEGVLVTTPLGLCNPASKIHDGNVTEIPDVGDMCWVNYALSLEYSPFHVKAADQFGEQTLDLMGPIILGVPSRILSYEPVLDHYLGYYAYNGTQYIGENVTLEDRFGAVNATVTYPLTFANPAEKWYDGVLSPIGYPDIHVLTYNITCESEPGAWLVVVENQFGIQELTVSGPTWLNAPAQKLEPYYHDPPVGAWHSLSYDVIAGEAVNQAVDLSDEFDDFEGVLVTTPLGLCNPASKIHDGNVTEIPDVGDMCWVNYALSLEYSPFHVKAADQFGEQTLDLMGPIILGVPSRILSYERIL